MIIMNGQGVGPGIAFGKLLFYRHVSAKIERRTVKDAQTEIERFEAARAKAISELAGLYTETAEKLGKEKSLLFQIHQMMLEDIDYCEAVRNKISGEGVCAEYAVSETSKKFAGIFSDMDDEYMKGRAVDVKDVSDRVIGILTGISDKRAGPKGTDETHILASDDLTPSETAQLDKTSVRAIITAGGSASSHTAIFAFTMGIPAVIGIGDRLEPGLEGKDAAVDGATGRVYIEPDSETLKDLQEKKLLEDKKRKLLEIYKGHETRTKDGKRLKLCANISSPRELDAVLENDAEGIGLFRSEFLFLERQTFPTEELQFNAYREAGERMRGKRVVIRTIDIGADKQAGYFNLPHEENPAMGMRAIRLCLTRPEVFKTQLRALYRASAFGRIAIMFPMITSVEEVRQIKVICGEVRESLRGEGIPFSEGTELGIMIETPAAAIISDELAQEVDFFSVGTNDLTQYTLAADRQDPQVRQFYDTHHKAIVRMIETSAENAHKAGIWIGICGELAADQAMTETFLRIGIDELSVPPFEILGLREKVSQINLKD